MGLTLAATKTGIYMPAGDIPDAVLPEVTGTYRENRGLMVCGTPVGGDEFIEETMLDVVEKYQTLHKRTRDMSETQCQYLLLRYCTCQNLNHWLRTVRPDLMRTAADLFDEETLATLQSVLWATGEAEHSINLTELQVMQVRQHCKLGGLGLSSAATVMPAAWLGSWCLTKNLVKTVLKKHDLVQCWTTWILIFTRI